jgi:hypothetical protein
MMSQVASKSDVARGFASEYSVDINSDISQIGALTPMLAQLDGIGRPAVHVTDVTGADYYLSRIDYCNDSNEIHAYRAIAIIMPGYRTKMAYWTKRGDKKEVSVHQGTGYLIIGDTDLDKLDDETDNPSDDDFKTAIFPLDPAITPHVTIPPGTFYTIEAAAWSPEPLVISGLSKTDADGNWEHTEIAIEPGEEIIMTPDGIVEVPDEFLSARFD